MSRRAIICGLVLVTFLAFGTERNQQVDTQITEDADENAVFVWDGTSLTVCGDKSYQCPYCGTKYSDCGGHLTTFTDHAGLEYETCWREIIRALAAATKGEYK
jgi:hypothetical protein